MFMKYQQHIHQTWTTNICSSSDGKNVLQGRVGMKMNLSGDRLRRGQTFAGTVMTGTSAARDHNKDPVTITMRLSS